MSCFHFPDNFQSVNCLTFIQIPPSTGLKVKVLYRLSMLPSICRLLILLSIGIISWKTGSKFLEYTFFTASWFKHISKTIWSLNVAVPRKISLLGQFLGNYQDRSVSLQRPILKIWDPTLKVSWCDASLILPFATQCHQNEIFSGWQFHQKAQLWKITGFVFVSL